MEEDGLGSSYYGRNPLCSPCRSRDYQLAYALQLPTRRRIYILSSLRSRYLRLRPLSKHKKIIMLTFSQEIIIGIWKDGKLIAIERKNGALERYMVEPANWGDTAKLYEVDKPV